MKTLTSPLSSVLGTLLLRLTFLTLIHCSIQIVTEQKALAETLLEAQTPEVASANLQVQLDATLSTDLIPAMTALLGSSGSPIRLGNTFAARYGQNQDAFVHIRLGLYDFPLSNREGLIHSFYLDGQVEMGFAGIFENPVIGELHGKLEGLAYAGVGVTGTIPSTPIQTRLGVLAGAGLGKRSDLISPDLLNIGQPVAESTQMIGADVHFSGSSSQETILRFHETFDYKGSLFLSSLGLVTGVHRWKSMTVLENSNWPVTSFLNIKPHLIAGAQPLPLDFLPRIWDFLHPGATQQTFLNYFGVGVEVGPTGAFGKKFKTFLGDYAGQVGGALAFEARAFQLRLGSWGLVLGPNSYTDSERLWYFSMGARF